MRNILELYLYYVWINYFYEYKFSFNLFVLFYFIKEEFKRNKK